MKNWIQLSGSVGRTPIKTGRYQSIYPSPYDVPQAVASCMDDENKVFSIFFRYLNDEETHKVQLDADFAVHLGKHSQRIYRIDLSSNLANTDGIARMAESIFSGLISSKSASVPLSRYSIPKQVVAEWESDILQAGLACE